MIPLPLAQALSLAVYVYLAAGLLLIPWWHWRGLRRLDAAAAGAAWTVRALLTPGLVLLWPLLLRRALRHASGHPPTEENAHRRAAAALEGEL